MKRFVSRLSFGKTHAGEHAPDRFLLGAIVVLALVGIVMVYNSSVSIALRDFSDQYHFIREQLKWLGIGFAAFIIFSKIHYQYWKKIAFQVLIGTIGLLVAVFIPGIGVRALGAHRWINLGVTVLQPAELAKLSMIIYLATWLSTKEKERLGAFLLLMGMVVGLIIAEPDLGTSIIVMVIAIMMYFLSGAPLAHFGMILPLLISGVGILAVAVPYRFKRLMTFINLDSDPLGASYQIRQALIAFGSGGMFGVGLGKSRQKYEYLPEANTDSIFAIIGEEVGFFGAVCVIGIFVFLVWRCFHIAQHSKDPFGKLLVLGIGSWVGVQSALNLGAMVALVPLTGVPLPLVSYGGSNLVITLAALGIVYNISKHTEEMR